MAEGHAAIQRDIDRLEIVQSRATKMMKGLKHLSCEEKLRHTQLFSMEKRRFRGILRIHTNTCRESGWRTEPASFQWCHLQVKRQWAQTESQEAPSEDQGTCFYCEGD